MYSGVWGRAPEAELLEIFCAKCNLTVWKVTFRPNCKLQEKLGEQELFRQ